MEGAKLLIKLTVRGKGWLMGLGAMHSISTSSLSLHGSVGIPAEDKKHKKAAFLFSDHFPVAGLFKGEAPFLDITPPQCVRLVFSRFQNRNNFRTC